MWGGLLSRERYYAAEAEAVDIVEGMRARYARAYRSVRDPGTPVQNTVISLSGPGINLVLCVLCWHLSGTFAFVNGFLAVMNLLPIRSSDGLRVYRIWKQQE